MAILEALGVDKVYEVEFTKKFASLSPEVFVDRILQQQLNCRVLSVGFNFRFGRNREGTTEMLRSRLTPQGIEVMVTPPVEIEGETVSSSRIREHVSRGETRAARRFLGRPYTIRERVESGQGRGRSLGFPTLNFSLQKTLHPRTGVYAVWFGLEERFPAVANFGFHPTVGASEEALLEVHVLERDMDVRTGEEAHVYFGPFLRPEQEFSSVEELKSQIQKDVDAAQESLNQLETPSVLHSATEAPLAEEVEC